VSSLPLVVLAGAATPGWVRLLRAAGTGIRAGTLSELLARPAGIIPVGNALDPAQVDRVDSWVRRGGHVATPDPKVLRSLGFGFSNPVSVSGARSAGPNVDATWTRPRQVRLLTGSNMIALTVAQGTQGVLMGERSVGRGEVVGLAVDPLGPGLSGYELLPTAANLIARATGAPPGPARDAAEIFVDPGDLPSSLRKSPDALAAAVAAAGGRVAEIAGWDGDFENPADDYDYNALIQALHAHGVLAYAWLEPPFVSLRFWDLYPACREITSTGRQAIVGWRRLIALEDPTCFALAEQSWDKLLTSFPWDGVNVAELYFEAPRPATNYTPFSPSALALFGGDPRKDPAAFARFRTQLVTQLNHQMLSYLNGLPHANQLGFELTIVDDHLDPAAGAGVGSDDTALAQDARTAGASLVVEDPFTTWSRGPLRYDTLAPAVAALMPKNDSLLDINVVNRSGARPTSEMTGSELALAVESATAPTGRLAVYALGTLTATDRADLAPAMAGAVVVTDSGVVAPWPVTVRAPSSDFDRLTVDGHPWPAGPGTALIPAGQHALHWQKGPPRGPALLSFTGQLSDAGASSQSMTIAYYSQPEALAVVNRRPLAVTVDGSPLRGALTAGPHGEWVLRLPLGTHTASLTFA
jgi:hypothetical protein